MHFYDLEVYINYCNNRKLLVKTRQGCGYNTLWRNGKVKIKKKPLLARLCVSSFAQAQDLWIFMGFCEISRLNDLLSNI